MLFWVIVTGSAVFELDGRTIARGIATAAAISAAIPVIARRRRGRRRRNTSPWSAARGGAASSPRLADRASGVFAGALRTTSSEGACTSSTAHRGLGGG